MTSTREIAAASVDALTGDRLRMRPVEDSELSTLESWWNDPGTLPFQTAGMPARPTGRWTEQFLTWYSNVDPSAVGFAVVRRGDGELIGTVVLHSMSARGHAATFGIILGPHSQGQGYGVEATRLMVDYGFRMLPLHRIGLEVWGYNDRARTVYERAGFRVEGERREVVFLDGEWHNQVLMSILRTEWTPAERTR